MPAPGDLVVFCDADVQDFDPGFVLGLLGPLLTRDDVAFVKGFYERPFDGRPGEGGRVTELMARPLISVFFPASGRIAQPLAGECAARREALEAIPFVGRLRSGPRAADRRPGAFGRAAWCSAIWASGCIATGPWPSSASRLSPSCSSRWAGPGFPTTPTPVPLDRPPGPPGRRTGGRHLR